MRKANIHLYLTKGSNCIAVWSWGRGVSCGIRAVSLDNGFVGLLGGLMVE